MEQAAAGQEVVDKEVDLPAPAGEPSCDDLPRRGEKRARSDDEESTADQQPPLPDPEPGIGDVLPAAEPRAPNLLLQARQGSPPPSPSSNTRSAQTAAAAPQPADDHAHDAAQNPAQCTWSTMAVYPAPPPWHPAAAAAAAHAMSPYHGLVPGMCPVPPGHMHPCVPGFTPLAGIAPGLASGLAAPGMPLALIPGAAPAYGFAPGLSAYAVPPSIAPGFAPHLPAGLAPGLLPATMLAHGYPPPFGAAHPHVVYHRIPPGAAPVSHSARIDPAQRTKRTWNKPIVLSGAPYDSNRPS